MKRKTIVALEAAPKEDLDLWQRELSLTLEQGGYIRLTFSGNNIAGCIAGIIQSVEGCHHSFDLELPISLTFRYWQLDQDLNDFSIEIGTHETMNGGETAIGCVRRMAAQAKMRFVAALARQQVTLFGPMGALEAA